MRRSKRGKPIPNHFFGPTLEMVDFLRYVLTNNFMSLCFNSAQKASPYIQTNKVQ